MDAGAQIAMVGLASGLVGSLLVFLVKIEHRMTKLETMLTERLPVKVTR